MRAEPDRSVAYQSVSVVEPPHYEWQQAGFVSFAYRLAHFILPRPAVILGISCLFYLT